MWCLLYVRSYNTLWYTFIYDFARNSRLQLNPCLGVSPLFSSKDCLLARTFEWNDLCIKLKKSTVKHAVNTISATQKKITKKKKKPPRPEHTAHMRKMCRAYVVYLVIDRWGWECGVKCQLSTVDGEQMWTSVWGSRSMVMLHERSSMGFAKPHLVDRSK